jgi:hypothetical protein
MVHDGSTQTSTVRFPRGHAGLSGLSVLPGVSVEMVRIAWSHRRTRWWARVPFVPVPSGTHLGWRRETAYGRSDVNARVGDIVEYAAWRRHQRKARS